MLQHTDPNYSCVYVTVCTKSGFYGYGLTFTLGRGTEIVLLAVKAMKYLVTGRNASEIFANFGQFWRELTSESQLRWVCQRFASVMKVKITVKLW